MKHHVEVQVRREWPIRFAAIIPGVGREGTVIWRCPHEHGSKRTAQRCGEKWLPWVERDQTCICAHPGPSGRHTRACEMAHDKASTDLTNP